MRTSDKLRLLSKLAPPKSAVVYEDDAHLSQPLVESEMPYWYVQGRDLEDGVSVPVALYTTSQMDLIRGCPYLFVGSLKSRQGTERVVTVAFYLQQLRASTRVISLDTKSYGDAFFTDPKAAYSSALFGGLSIKLAGPDTLRFYSAEVDGSDPSRFLAGYVLNGAAGTLSGSLNNDLSITLTDLTGALSISEQVGQSADANDP